MPGQCALAGQVVQASKRTNTKFHGVSSVWQGQAGQRKGNVLCLALRIRKERLWWSLSSRKLPRTEGRPLIRAAVLDHIGLASTVYVNVGDCSPKGQDGKNDCWLVKKWLVLFINYCGSVLAFGDVVKSCGDTESRSVLSGWEGLTDISSMWIRVRRQLCWSLDKAAASVTPRMGVCVCSFLTEQLRRKHIDVISAPPAYIKAPVSSDRCYHPGRGWLTRKAAGFIWEFPAARVKTVVFHNGCANLHFRPRCAKIPFPHLDLLSFWW